MANKIQFRRGSDAERGTVKLDSGEPGWTTDTKKLYVGDGATYGGIDIADAAKTTTGTFGLARIPAIDDVRIPDLETLSYGAAFATAQIPGVGAYKVASGTLAVARHETLDNLNGTVALAQVPTMDDGHVPDLETLSYGAAFATAQIPGVGAYKVASGTLAVARHETLDNLNGTVALAQVPTMDDGHVPDLETLSYGAAFATAQIPNLPTTKITSGTFGIARIPSITNAYLAGDITSDKIPALSGTAIAYPLNADTVGTTAIKTAGVGNDELAASGLDIEKCTVGTAGLARIPTMDDGHVPDLETLSYGAAFATAQIPGVGAYKTTTGTFGAARIPALPTARITSGTFNIDRVPDVGVVAINYVIDGGGAAITAGTVGFLEVPFACHANRWTLMADQHGSFVVDIWRDSYSNFPPTDADSMSGTTNMPAISGTVISQSTDLSGWGTQGISAGDILAYHVDSCSSIELCTIALRVQKT